VASVGSVTSTELQRGICEVQTITVASDAEFVREKQVLHLTLTSSGKTASYKVSYLQSSVTLTLPISAASLETSLNSLIGPNGAPVRVEVGLITANSNTDYSYEIKFISPVGDTALLDFKQVTTNSDVTVVGITETVKGISPINGTFTIFFEGAFTNDLHFDASAADVQAALEALSTIGHVDVDREDTGNGFKWTVSFIQNVGNLRMMAADAYRYEIQRLVTTGGSPTPLYGQFTISYGSDTVDVPYDASNEELRAALESLPSVGAVEVARTANINGQFEWLITFRELIGNVALLGVDQRLLLGSDADVNIYEVVAGNNATLSGAAPRLSNIEKTSGRPDYTGEYIVRTPGKYEIAVTQLISGGLTASYYDNQWFYGSPSVEQIDPLINFDWGLGLLTSYSSDFVSIAWAGKIRVEKSELYTVENYVVYLCHFCYFIDIFSFSVFLGC
jgi:hypothetical protein